MKTNIFVNIAVSDLEKAKAFYGELGFTFNPQFTDDTAASMVINDSIYFMLLTYNKFQSFIKDHNIVNPNLINEAIYSLSLESREEVDAFLEKVVAAGGAIFREPEDYGYMFARSFTDPDGHIWEVFWMDPNHIQK